MKKISILAFLFAGMLSFSSCESDIDSNPILQDPTEFVLNTPAYVNTTYDLANSTSLELTCSQPNFGYTAPTIYNVEVSLSEDFGKSVLLDTKYSTAKMNVDASELAVAMTNMLVEAGMGESAFPVTTGMYLRLKAELNSATSTVSSITSNVIHLPNVKVEFALPPVLLPETIYVVGNHNGWNWGNSLPSTLVWGTDNMWWRMTYLDGGWKFNSATEWNGSEVGYDGAAEIIDNANANITRSDDGNIVTNNPGWYLLVFTAEVVGREVKYKVAINEPEVWMIGDVTGVDWHDRAAGWQLEVPTNADGEFVSPAFAAAASADNGVRVYCPIEGHDPWHSEFMVFDGNIKYRGTGGDQDRVTASAGQKLYLNFSTDKGEIK